MTFNRIYVFTFLRYANLQARKVWRVTELQTEKYKKRMTGQLKIPFWDDCALYVSFLTFSLTWFIFSYHFFQLHSAIPYR